MTNQLGGKLDDRDLGTWLDWQAQGVRMSSNIYDRNNRDIFVEVSHGPYVVDNNIFTSPFWFVNAAQGGTEEGKDYGTSEYNGAAVSMDEYIARFLALGKGDVELNNRQGKSCLKGLTHNATAPFSGRSDYRHKKWRVLRELTGFSLAQVFMDCSFKN